MNLWQNVNQVLMYFYRWPCTACAVYAAVNAEMLFYIKRNVRTEINNRNIEGAAQMSPDHRARCELENSTFLWLSLSIFSQGTEADPHTRSHTHTHVHNNAYVTVSILNKPFWEHNHTQSAVWCLLWHHTAALADMSYSVTWRAEYFNANTS